MKLVFRIIGLAVVIVVLAAALLYFLNEKNILKGPLADWITRVKENVFNIKDDTEEMIHQMKDSDDPIGDSLNVPGKSQDNREEQSEQQTGEDAAQESPAPADQP